MLNGQLRAFNSHDFVLVSSNNRRCCAVMCCADITTKDLLTDRQLWHNPPCCPGSRSPPSLVRSWYVMCCAPTSYRPWQRQQRSQHFWHQLPVSEDAVVARAVHEASGSNDLLPGQQGTVSARHAMQEQLQEAGTAGAGAAAPPDAALQHRFQPQQQEGSLRTIEQPQQLPGSWGRAEV